MKNMRNFIRFLKADRQKVAERYEAWRMKNRRRSLKTFAEQKIRLKVHGILFSVVGPLSIFLLAMKRIFSRVKIFR